MGKINKKTIYFPHSPKNGFWVYVKNYIVPKTVFGSMRKKWWIFKVRPAPNKKNKN